jgi:hypothetical protein
MVVAKAAMAIGISGLTATAIGVVASHAIVYGGVLMGLGKLSRALAKKPSAGSLNSAQARQITLRQAAAPRACIYGSQLVGGVITFANVNGTTLDIVITISGHEIEAIDNIYFDGEEVVFSGGAATGKYSGYVSMEQNLGSDSQTAFPDLMAALPSLWTSDHRQRGCAGVHFSLIASDSLFPGGLPNITFAVRGKKVYDPRTPATAYSANAALCAADLLTDDRFGFDADYATEVEDATLIAAANTCGESVLIATGPDVYEERYTINGKFDSAEDPGTVLEQMAGAMAGYIVFSAGKWQIVPGAFRSTAITLTDADIVAPARIETKRSLRDLFNTVKGTYIDPNKGSQETSFPEVTNSTYVTADGGTKIYKSIFLPFTNSGTMAQRIAKIDLERNRRQVSCEITANLNLYNAQPGNVAAWTHSRLSWSSKTFEVAQMGLTPFTDRSGGTALAVTAVLKEVDVNVYGFAVGEYGTEVDPATLNLPTGAAMSPEPATALTLSAGLGGNLHVNPTVPDGIPYTGFDIVFLVDNETERTGAATQLNGSITNVAATMTVDSVDGLLVGEAVNIEREIVVITGPGTMGETPSGLTLDISRAQYGSSAAAHADNTKLYVLRGTETFHYDYPAGFVAAQPVSGGNKFLYGELWPFRRMRILYARIVMYAGGVASGIFEKSFADALGTYEPNVSGTLCGLRTARGDNSSLSIEGAVEVGAEQSEAVAIPPNTSLGPVYVTVEEAPEGQDIVGVLQIDDPSDPTGFSDYSAPFTIPAGQYGSGTFFSGAEVGNVGGRQFIAKITQRGTVSAGYSRSGVMSGWALSALGSGYQVGDVLTATAAGTTHPQFIVALVDFVGQILAAFPVELGEGCSVASSIALTGGSGTGAQIDILSIASVTVGAGEPKPGKELTVHLPY